MKPQVTTGASQQELRGIRDGLERQQRLLKALQKGDDLLVIAQHILTGLEAMKTMLELQNAFLVEDVDPSLTMH